MPCRAAFSQAHQPPLLQHAVVENPPVLDRNRDHCGAFKLRLCGRRQRLRGGAATNFRACKSWQTPRSKSTSRRSRESKSRRSRQSPARWTLFVFYCVLGLKKKNSKLPRVFKQRLEQPRFVLARYRECFQTLGKLVELDQFHDARSARPYLAQRELDHRLLFEEACGQN